MYVVTASDDLLPLGGDEPCVEHATLLHNKLFVHKHFLITTNPSHPSTTTIMSTITGTVTKEAADSKVGISFEKLTDESPVMVKDVKKGGLFAATDILPGLLVLTVNGVDVTDKNCPKHCASLLRDAEAGEVTLVAKGVVAKGRKATPDGLCGVTMRKVGESLKVAKINESGIFGSSELVEGLTLASINGTKCPPNPKDAAKLLKEAKKDVTIVAWDPEWAVVEADAEPEPEPEAAPVKEEKVTKAVEEEYVQVETPTKKEVVEEQVEEQVDENKDEEPPHSILDNLCTMCSA